MISTKIKIVLVSLIILSVAVAFYFVSLITEPKQYLEEDSNSYDIWLCSDAQLVSNSSTYSSTNLVRAIKDINCNLGGVDVAFHIGDNINGYNFDDNDFDSYDYAETMWEWNKFHEIWDTLDAGYKNYIIGNHECYPFNDINNNGWVGDGQESSWRWPIVDCWIKTSHGNYTYDFGNIRFIILGVEAEQVDQNTSFSKIGNQTIWLREKIEESNDYNIIILSHIPLTNTSKWHYNHPSPWGGLVPEEDEILHSIIKENDNIIAFFSGHWHQSQHNKDMVIKVDNCVFSNTCCINRAYESSVESQLLRVTEGSLKADILSRDHIKEEWNDINGNHDPAGEIYSFELKFPFKLD